MPLYYVAATEYLRLLLAHRAQLVAPVKRRARLLLLRGRAQRALKPLRRHVGGERARRLHTPSPGPRRGRARAPG
jgi:hypothetical protein